MIPFYGTSTCWKGEGSRGRCLPPRLTGSDLFRICLVIGFPFSKICTSAPPTCIPEVALPGVRAITASRSSQMTSNWRKSGRRKGELIEETMQNDHLAISNDQIVLRERETDETQRQSCNCDRRCQRFGEGFCHRLGKGR